MSSSSNRGNGQSNNSNTRPETARISPIPIIHKRSQSNISPSGGYYTHIPSSSSPSPSATSSSSSSHLNKYSITKNEIPDNLLLIDPRDKYIVKEGFGLTAPVRKIVNIPPLVAHNALFVKPPEPEPIPVEDREVQTEQPILFKREMDSLHDYQEWIAQNIDPLLKVKTYLSFFSFFF